MVDQLEPIRKGFPSCALEYRIQPPTRQDSHLAILNGKNAVHSTFPGRKSPFSDWVQLAQLGLKPSDIDYLSLSHLHPDHSGNANLFSGSTFIVNELERQHMFSDDVKATFGASYAALEDAETLLFKNEHDVFGDGSVVIKSMPGHTPGSCVLLIRLNGAGNILLSGDLYTHARAREQQTIPVFNSDKQALLDSRQKFETLVTKEKARVVIQHSKVDFDMLPSFPAFLD